MAFAIGTTVRFFTEISNADSPYRTETIPIYVLVNPIDSTKISSETNATIARVAVKEGDSFKAGDVLIEFDCRVQKSELQKALAQQTLAKSTRDSANKLNSYGSISESELIKAKSEAEIADAEVNKISAVVDKCTIKSAYDGAVSESIVHAGETVKPGDLLLKIINLEHLELDMQVPSNWLQWLRVGTKFRVNINEINKTVAAEVYKINPQINPVSQTVKIIAITTKPEPGILPGMSGQAIFEQGDSNTTSKQGQGG